MRQIDLESTLIDDLAAPPASVDHDVTRGRRATVRSRGFALAKRGLRCKLLDLQSPAKCYKRTGVVRR